MAAAARGKNCVRYVLWNYCIYSAHLRPFFFDNKMPLCLFCGAVIELFVSESAALAIIEWRAGCPLCVCSSKNKRRAREGKDATRLLFHCVFANSNLTRRLISAKDAANRALNKKNNTHRAVLWVIHPFSFCADTRMGPLLREQHTYQLRLKVGLNLAMAKEKFSIVDILINNSTYYFSFQFKI